MLKKIILAVAAIGVSSAALAHDGRGRDHDRFREHRVERFHEERRPMFVEHGRPMMVQPSPQVVYAQPPVAYPQPAPGIDIHLPW